MTPDALRDYCLSFSGSREEHPFSRAPGLSAFKAGTRVFAFCALDDEPLRITLKCEPELAVQLRGAHPAIAPGYHLDKRHWNTVTLDGTLPDRMVEDLIEDSYDLVVAGLPRRERLLLGRG
jgi:predicted DNA-binding protein (MmcQ/YjbR family)